MKSDGFYIVILLASVVFFIVARKMFSDYIKVGSPNLLAGVLALITVIGFLNIGEEIITAVLIPYQAVALAMLIILMLMPLLSFASRLKNWFILNIWSGGESQTLNGSNGKQMDQSNSSKGHSGKYNSHHSARNEEDSVNHVNHASDTPQHRQSYSSHVTSDNSAEFSRPIYVRQVNPSRFVCPGCGEKSGGNNGDYCPTCEAFVHKMCSHRVKVSKQPFLYFLEFDKEKLTCPICKTAIGVGAF